MCDEGGQDKGPVEKKRIDYMPKKDKNERKKESIIWHEGWRVKNITLVCTIRSMITRHKVEWINTVKSWNMCMNKWGIRNVKWWVMKYWIENELKWLTMRKIEHP